MLFWLLCALLIVAVTVVVLRPLLWGDGATMATDDRADLQVYKDQLAEIDNDVARGLISEDQAGAARTEVSRRILALDVAHQTQEAANPAASSATLTAGIAAVVIVGVSFSFYLAKGSPVLEGRPYASRLTATAHDGRIDQLVAKVEARLRKEPGDGKGWDVLAPVYLKQERFADAASAYWRAIQLLGDSQRRLAGYARAHLALSNGIVGDEVRQAYAKMLAREPDLVVPRFWLAVGHEQDGKPGEARKAYEELLATGNADSFPEALRNLVRERLARITGDKQPAPSEKAGPKAPTAAADSVPRDPSERQHMIEGMVGRLAERLDQDGGTREDWQKLIRSYVVLGRRDKAVAALAKARSQISAGDGERELLDSFARNLGLTQVR